ncbi:MAG: type I DNA topoisomerase [Acidithiobacillales bacterium]
MDKSLVIVESPAKANTLARFLGKEFTVRACYGHVRDLPRKGISVDRERGYEPSYEVLPGKERVLAELKRAGKGAGTVFLAADPDREGEAICWHLREVLRPALRGAEFKRAEFQEITKSAVTRAVEHPGTIDMNRVAAQQARRIIDRLVGYEVSDLLWSKVWRGLSAGRVQTVTLRIIVERETERERFVAVPYFSVPCTLRKGEAAFPARVVLWGGEKLKFDGTDPRLATREAAEAVAGHVRSSALRVVSVEAKERRSAPPPPFTTSKLQQAAARVLGFTVRRTMQVAQRLYEGKALGERGTVGLITYMRTDSTRTADEALRAVREAIVKSWGEGALNPEVRRFRQKKGTQDAHEAIRPTSMDLPPEAVARFLTSDELKLYRLIWTRFVASQMSPSISEITTVDIEARVEGRGEVAGLRATGTVLKDAGWLRAHGETADDETPEEENGRGGGDAAGEEREAAGAKVRLPEIVEGETLPLVAAAVEAHETQPPPRFGEASLVKFLEENGIGRPSTYAEILRKIEDRAYVRKKDRRFIPTPLGRLVVDLMLDGFDDFFETGYTARMEEELDEVEEGSLDWRKALTDFDGKFVRDRERAKKKMVSLKAGLPLEKVRKTFVHFHLPNGPGDTCPKSGHALKLRMGKAGLFIACAGYPKCDFTQDIPEVEEDEIDASDLEGQTCEECGSPMKLRTGRSGSAFLGCTAYPACRSTVPVSVAGGKAEARPDIPTGETCPSCGRPLVTKHGRYGDYVACSGWPACRYRPPKPVTTTGVACPECRTGEILVRRGRFGPFYGCSNYPKCPKNFRARPVPKSCPSCGAPYLLVRDRKAGPFFVCDKEGCGFEAAAQDLDLYAPTTKLPEKALATDAEAAMAPSSKRIPRSRAPNARGARKKK